MPFMVFISMSLICPKGKYQMQTKFIVVSSVARECQAFEGVFQPMYLKMEYIIHLSLWLLLTIESR